MPNCVVPGHYPGVSLRASRRSQRVVPRCGHPASGQASVDLDGHNFAVGFVDDVQGSKGLAVIKRVVHKIQRPGDVLLGWRNQWLLGQFWKTALVAP